MESQHIAIPGLRGGVEAFAKPTGSEDPEGLLSPEKLAGI